jgi:hypothetical protein
LSDKGLYVIPFVIVAVAYPLAMLAFAIFLKPIPLHRSGQPVVLHPA